MRIKLNYFRLARGIGTELERDKSWHTEHAETHVFAFILGTGDKYRSWSLTTEDGFVSRGTSLRIAKHKKRPRYLRKRHETCACLRHIVSPFVSSLHVLPISRMSVYIFLTTFFPRIPQSTRFSPSYLPFVRICLSSLFIAFLSLSLFPSFSELPRNACAFHPEKWIFLFGKKSEKSADSLHEVRGGSLLIRGRKRSDAERTNVGQNRENGRTEGCWRKGSSRRGREERRERESRVKQRRSRRENENHASAYEERGWNWGRERCLSRKVEILGDGGKEIERERERTKRSLIMRVLHERGTESTSKPLTEGDRKSCVIYRVTPPI